MKLSLKRLLPKTITAQITTLMVAAVFVGILLTFVALMLLFGGSRMRMNPELKAAAEAARIATVVKQVKATQSATELADILSSVQAPGAYVEQLPRSKLSARPANHAADNGFILAVTDILRQTWGIRPLEDLELPGWTNTVIVNIDENRVLLFQDSEYQAAQTFIIVQASVALLIILVAVLVLSVYAIRWVTKPLSAFAQAARAFGRSPTEDRALKVDGPHEIAQVAEALNDMRTRVRTLVEERTRMLAAISHDLRTPLTRLRLRSERVFDLAERGNMLRDIASIDSMISETLAYLRDGGSSEPIERIDLPSLLQTICGEFSDIGHQVLYTGPDRLAFACRARALTRAVTNVVDNGIKHGSLVTVALQISSATAVHIDIADDGPGIPPALRDKVFEPFFKADSARSSLGGGGFGLGLSIARDVVQRHGGDISLASNIPHGLVVRLSLGADSGPRSAAPMRMEEVS